MTQKLNILVTGAAGFIGFHTCLRLKEHKIIALDNFDPYYSVELKNKRAEELSKAGIDVIRGDILDKELLLDIVKKHSITNIIHLAAQAGVRYSLENPEAYLKTNVDGFLSVLEVVRMHPSIKLIYASSSSVYGTNDKIPYATSDRTDHQASLYGVTKKANELMAQSYHHLFNLDLVGLRFFTVYGPWGRPDMAYFLFTKAIDEDKPIQLFNFGNCERDFTYIDDIVEGIVACLRLPKGNSIYNLGNHKPVKLSYFVETLENLLEKKAEKKLLPLQAGDVVATFADIESSIKDLGYHPKTSIEEGLSHFVKWYKKYQRILPKN